MGAEDGCGDDVRWVGVATGLAEGVAMVRESSMSRHTTEMCLPKASQCYLKWQEQLSSIGSNVQVLLCRHRGKLRMRLVFYHSPHLIRRSFHSFTATLQLTGAARSLWLRQQRLVELIYLLTAFETACLTVIECWSFGLSELNHLNLPQYGVIIENVRCKNSRQTSLGGF